MRRLWPPAILILVPYFACAQSADWSALFHKGASNSEAERQEVRQKGAETLIPRVLSEDPDDAKVDAVSIAAQLSDRQRDVRLQASGYLLLISISRHDSSDVLRTGFAMLQKHFTDPDPNVASNAINTISALNPQVPDEQIHVLASFVTSAKNPAGLKGVARMVNANGFAFDFVSKLIADDSALKAGAIRALGAVHTYNESLVKQIAPLLNTGDNKLRDAALFTVGSLGAPAIALARDQLTILANDSSDPQNAQQAEKLLSK